MLYVYVDGSCNSQSGEGAWSYIINKVPFYGREWDTTNNRMELVAAIKALEHFKEPQNIVILSDSQYVVKGAMIYIKAWQKKNWRNYKDELVKNRDLWENLLAAQKNHNQVVFKWVPREKNKAADKAARRARGV